MRHPLRLVGAAADPSLRLESVRTLEEVTREGLALLRIIYTFVAIVAAIILGLSTSAIYAVMSFFVARRTREIGIRTALGATRLQPLRDILGWALRYVGLGVPGVGSALAVAGLMGAAGIAACAAPTLRALSIHPTEAMRADA